MISPKKLINEYRKNKKELRDILLQNADLLEPGVYKVNESRSVLYNKKYKKSALKENGFVFFEQFKKAQKATKAKYERLSSLLISIFHKDKIKTENQNYLGQCLIFSTLKNDLHIINYRENAIYTRFKNAERMALILKNRKKWENLGFRAVPVFGIDKNRLLLKEKFINKVHYDHEKGFDFVLDDILRCFRENQGISHDYSLNETDLEKLKSLSSRYESSEKREDFLRKLNDFASSGAYKKYTSHGDVYYNNLMYDGKFFYYSDFEMMQEHFFVFDILFYIFFESFRFQNDTLLNNYLNGNYDDELKEIFDLNGAVYQTDLRTIYLWILCYEYYGTRIPGQFVAKLIRN